MGELANCSRVSCSVTDICQRRRYILLRAVIAEHRRQSAGRARQFHHRHRCGRNWFGSGGLGTFEGTAIAMLHSHGLSIETALAATLLFRGFTFWLPMIPGLWLSRRELKTKSRDAMR